MPVKKRWDPSPTQQAFLNAFFSRSYRYLLFGGGVAGGKTQLICALTAVLCKMYPGSRYAIVRKDLPRIRRNIIPTWEAVVPKSFFEQVNRSTWVVRAHNGSEVLFIGATEEKDPNHDRIRGLELSGAFCDEINELSEDFFNVLRTRVGRWNSDPRPPPFIVGTCNPTTNWVKTVWYDPWSSDALREPWFYLPSRATDNPHLTAEYIQTLNELPPDVKRVLVDGDWSVAADPDALLDPAWVEDAFFRDPLTDLSLPKRLAVDVARYGNDDTVIMHTADYTIKSLESWNGIDTTKTTQRVITAAGELGITGDDIRIDAIGVGAGVADQVAQAGLSPFDYKGGAKPAAASEAGYFKFKNRRAADHWNLRELFKAGWISLEDTINDRDRMRLKADLMALKYKVDSEKVVAIESKEQLKKRLGRSPDYSDALVMAFAEVDRKPKFRFVSV